MSDNTPRADYRQQPVRRLPPLPNLEFERKRAKALLRQLDAGSQLSDAQLICARDYGFASWPRLVAYYTAWHRHLQSEPKRAQYEAKEYERQVDAVFTRHAGRDLMVAHLLATYVPRLYGATDPEIFATQIERHEAEHAVARRNRFASWERLLAAVPASRQESVDFPATPYGMAQAAIGQDNIALLQQIVAANPDLLAPGKHGLAIGSGIISSALHHEWESRSAIAREMTDWLVSQGADIQTPLNQTLLGGLHVPAARIQWALDRGANPRWTPRNGVSIIEHLLLHCWTAGAADPVAAIVKPRKAFWIAAGMGDVASMRTYFDPHGNLTDAARNDRPDFTAIGLPLPCRPDISDLDILWEAMLVAGMNQRANAIDFLLDKGVPVDYAPLGQTLGDWARGNHIEGLMAIMAEREQR